MAQAPQVLAPPLHIRLIEQGGHLPKGGIQISLIPLDIHPGLYLFVRVPAPGVIALGGHIGHVVP